MIKVSSEWHCLSESSKSIICKYQNELPVKLGEIAKEFGLIVKVATLSANISGEIKEIDGVITIKINRHEVKARQRFTLAHEIAHFLLHRHLLKEGIQDDVLYRSKQSNAVEAEANRLAADILMPAIKTQALIDSLRPDLEWEKVYEEVADCLLVSSTALKIKLGKA